MCKYSSANNPSETISMHSNESTSEAINEANAASSSGSPWYELRRDVTAIVSQALERGCRKLWQLTTSRVSVLLSSTAFSSTSIHQFLKNYEDLDVFILAGESFYGVEASEFRSKVMAACENYFRSFHRQNIHHAVGYVSRNQYYGAKASLNVWASKYMEKFIPFTGLLRTKPEENPDFYNWNRDKVRYCDDASFAGEGYDREHNMYFRGQRIYSIATEELMSHGMRKAEQAFLSGCLPGSLASILHCDEFRGLFSERKRVKCFSYAGLLIDAVDVSGG